MTPGNLTTDARKKLAANLQVLRRYDNQIEAIIDTTSHVVLYQFQEDTQSWANKEVEGALFIYKRATMPHYGFTIMNRVGVENYTEYLSAEMSFQTSGQILIYTSKNSSSIVGVWIYEEEDRARIPEQLSICCKSEAGDQSPQRLYPKNANEESEFQRLYPRSRSNSRKDGNALSTIVNHTRQQKQQQKQQQQKCSTDSSVLAADAGGVADLVKKLRAIGIEPTANLDNQPKSAVADAAGIKADYVQFSGAQHANEQEQVRRTQPTVQLANGQGVAAVFQAVTMSIQPPSSPALHPAPSPFPPSTIATPLPAQGMSGIGPGASYGQTWQAQMSGPPMARPAHASPAPAAYGAGMQGIPGMVVPEGMSPQPLGVPAVAGASIAQNLAEQLVSLVRQRMNTLHTGSTTGNTAVVAQAQREYCREWLIRVIQMDDELVDAFVRRFPPPAPPPQQQ
ncbi:hypothetical protein IW140_003422 [Coemansia sp. RSA 1813]|nr:hypothetical protein EV178_003240 [Coemansia sp. RSA 1646]KAJ1767881.1 hypothetical protein LPJ74_005128 [Coemansia sp. RSA 1843]KAJ2089286.1 hypothetical protein IW138_003606 [Coemansia sp. RSA 986]KAJ2215115.1 hypothetical protein EV179_002483 [Coemansia sp. RSA 487]KAJ2569057.1 hypothetical protein IW140_003422 [Coemansia sp. RSA 1813]